MSDANRERLRAQVPSRHHFPARYFPNRSFEALLPDRWVTSHPEHRLDQREEGSREAQARRRKRAARRVAVKQ